MTSSFGWRFSVALLGTLSILMVGRAARRMFGSTLLGTHRGAPAGVRGAPLRPLPHRPARPHRHVLGAGGVLRPADRPRPLARAARPQGRRAAGRRRPPRLARAALRARGWARVRGAGWPGCAWACAAGTKWSGLFFLVVFGLMTVCWDMGARRAAGVRRWWLAAVVKDGLYAAAGDGRASRCSPTSAPGPGGSTHRDGYDRQWAATHPGDVVRLGAGRRCARCGSTTARCTSSTSRSPRPTRTRPTPGRGWSRAGRPRSSTRAPSGAGRLHGRRSAPRRSPRSARRRCGGAARSRSSSCCSCGRCAATGAPGRSSPASPAGYLPWFNYQEPHDLHVLRRRVRAVHRAGRHLRPRAGHRAGAPRRSRRRRWGLGPGRRRTAC